jgi:rare lipoprotein A
LKKKLWLLAFIALFLVPFVPVHAQEPAKPNLHKNNTRILYGLASFYSNKFNGRKTANGEIFSQSKLTCACNVLPLGTWIRVTNLANGNKVIVKTNDRLHPAMKRLVDLSRAAARKLNYESSGLTRVKVEVLGKKPLSTID